MSKYLSALLNNGERLFIACKSDFLAACQRSSGNFETEIELMLPDDDGNLSLLATIGIDDLENSWENLLEWTRKSNEAIFMLGDCWYFSLAMHSLYGLPLISFTNRITGVVEHIATSISGDGGPYLDIRGLTHKPEVPHRFMPSGDRPQLQPESSSATMSLGFLESNQSWISTPQSI